MTLLRSLLGLEALWTAELFLTRALQIALIVGACQWIRLTLCRRDWTGLWTCALAGSIALPLLAALVPPFEVSIPAPGTAMVLDNSVTAGVVRQFLVTTIDPMAPTRGLRSPGDPPAPEPGMFAWLGLVWLTGTGMLLLRLGRGLLGLETLRSCSVVATDTHTSAALLAARTALRFTGRVELRVSDEISTAVSFGWLRPTIIVARSSCQDPLLLAAVVRHELVHLQQQDWVRLVVAKLACAMYWFNPAIWFLAKNQHVAMELEADRRAVATGLDRLGYAEYLLALTTVDHETQLTTAWRTRSDSTLVLRVRALTTSIQVPISPVQRVLGLALFAFITGGAAGLRSILVCTS